MNVEKFRRTLKLKWLAYYRDNRDWLDSLSVWETYRGQRRPASSFILAALSILEPKLTQLLPLVVGLNTDPDRIVLSLGLNFDPAEELERLSQVQMKKLPEKTSAGHSRQLSVQPARPIEQRDEECTGIRRDRTPPPIAQRSHSSAQPVSATRNSSSL